jgi:predicted nuclease of restriction endonuclease-like (RecB) superfamily
MARQLLSPPVLQINFRKVEKTHIMKNNLKTIAPVLQIQHTIKTVKLHPKVLDFISIDMSLAGWFP